MNILTHSVPVWVSLLFLLSMGITIYLIAYFAKQGGHDTQSANKIFNYVIGFYLVYFLYVSVMSVSGIFQAVTLPPNIFFYTAIPLFLFFMLGVRKFTWFQLAFEKITLQSLVNIHIFRFIGIFFLISYYYGALPSKFAIIAGVGDIVTATLSIGVVRAINAKKSYAKVLTLGWNILGILDIVSVIISANITTKNYIDTGSQGLSEIINFPFSFIPAFAPATIIFLHILIFKKLSNFHQE